MSKFISITVGIILVPFSLYLLFRIGLIAVGYKFAETPEILAEELVQANRPADDCFSFLTLDFGPRPSLHEMRMRCVRTYAELKADPEVCQLLLPSRYAWSCLGDVESMLGKGFGCGSTKENINCIGNIHVPNMGIEDCSQYNQKTVRDWCHEERTATLNNVYECGLISSEPIGLREECQRRYAFKLKNPQLCSSITNEKRRKLCEIEIDAWVKYSDQWSL